MSEPTLREDELRRAQEVVARELDLAPLVEFVTGLFVANREQLDRANAEAQAAAGAKNELTGQQTRGEELEAKLAVADERNRRAENLKADLYRRINEMGEKITDLTKNWVGDRRDLVWHTIRCGELAEEVEKLKGEKLALETRLIEANDLIRVMEQGNTDSFPEMQVLIEAEPETDEEVRRLRQANGELFKLIEIVIQLVVATKGTTMPESAEKALADGEGGPGRIESFLSAAIGIKDASVEIISLAVRGTTALHAALKK